MWKAVVATKPFWANPSKKSKYNNTIKNLSNFVITVERVKELFYLCEVVVQTLENFPFWVKEKDLFSSYAVKCKVFFCWSEWKRKAINCQGWVHPLCFQVLQPRTRIRSQSLGLKVSYKGTEEPFHLVFRFFQIKVAQNVSASKISQSVPGS